MSGIKEPTDVCQSLGLIQPSQQRRNLGISFGINKGLREWRNSNFPCPGMAEGGLPPPRVTWVIRLTSLLTEKSVMLVDLREEPVVAWLSAYTFPQLSTTLGSHLQ